MNLKKALDLLSHSDSSLKNRTPYKSELLHTQPFKDTYCPSSTLLSNVPGTDNHINVLGDCVQT